MSPVKIRAIDLATEADSFFRFPWAVYRQEPHWVPPLLFERREFFSPDKNPYFKLADVQCFVATRGDQVVGTISAQVDYGYQDVEEGVGFFGFFEFLDDPEVSAGLYAAAKAWLAERGMRSVMGPFNFNTNHECGLLVDGFDSDPMVLMTYNPRYYQQHYENLGLAARKDLLAYWLDATAIPDRITKITKRFMDRHPEVRIRPVDLSRFDEELAMVKEIYNDAWEDNWGFVRLTDAEFSAIAKGLKPMIDPRYCYVAEVDGQAVAFSVSLPDFNVVVKPMNGRIFPFGWWHFLTKPKTISAVRVFALGVRKAYQKMPLGLPLYERTWQAAIDNGLRGGEASWILDDNTRMRGALEKMGGRIYKTYRIYGLEL